MDEIAVIGARSLGHATSADLTLRGFKVSLYEEPKFKELLEPIMWRGGIDLLLERYYTVHAKPTLNFEKVGFARVHQVTTNIEEAVRNAGVIIVAVHAYRHECIAKLLAPHLRDGQTIVISAGNVGSLVFSRTWKAMGVRAAILLAETCPSLYGARFGPEYGLGEGQCATPGPVLVDPEDPRARPILISAFPAKDTDKAMNSLKGIFKLVAGFNVLEVSLSNPNLWTHVPMSIMSASWIDQSGGRFRLHLQARTPSVMRVCEAMRRERDAVFKAMGWVDRYALLPKAPSKTPSPITLHIGPTSLDKHRFIAEDARIGDTFLASLGDMIGVPTPTIKAVVHLASVVNQTDYLKIGRIVEKVGIAGLSIDGLNKFLTEGHI